MITKLFFSSTTLTTFLLIISNLPCIAASEEKITQINEPTGIELHHNFGTSSMNLFNYPAGESKTKQWKELLKEETYFAALKDPHNGSIYFARTLPTGNLCSHSLNPAHIIAEYKAIPHQNPLGLPLISTKIYPQPTLPQRAPLTYYPPHHYQAPSYPVAQQASPFSYPQTPYSYPPAPQTFIPTQLPQDFIAELRETKLEVAALRAQLTELQQTSFERITPSRSPAESQPIASPIATDSSTSPLPQQNYEEQSTTQAPERVPTPVALEPVVVQQPLELSQTEFPPLSKIVQKKNTLPVAQTHAIPQQKRTPVTTTPIQKKEVVRKQQQPRKPVIQQPKAPIVQQPAVKSLPKKPIAQVLPTLSRQQRKKLLEQNKEALLVAVTTLEPKEKSAKSMAEILEERRKEQELQDAKMAEKEAERAEKKRAKALLKAAAKVEQEKTPVKQLQAKEVQKVESQPKTSTVTPAKLERQLVFLEFLETSLPEKDDTSLFTESDRQDHMALRERVEAFSAKVTSQKTLEGIDQAVFTGLMRDIIQQSSTAHNTKTAHTILFMHQKLLLPLIADLFSLKAIDPLIVIKILARLQLPLLTIPPLAQAALDQTAHIEGSNKRNDYKKILCSIFSAQLTKERALREKLLLDAQTDQASFLLNIFSENQLKTTISAYPQLQETLHINEIIPLFERYSLTFNLLIPKDSIQATTFFYNRLRTNNTPCEHTICVHQELKKFVEQTITNIENKTAGAVTTFANFYEFAELFYVRPSLCCNVQFTFEESIKKTDKLFKLMSEHLTLEEREKIDERIKPIYLKRAESLQRVNTILSRGNQESADAALKLLKKIGGTSCDQSLHEVD